jgi:preprotein translocase subunit SecE
LLFVGFLLFIIVVMKNNTQKAALSPKLEPSIFKGIQSELKKVEWPTRKEALHLTLVVVIISFLIGAYIGVLDYLFAQLLKILISIKQ